MFMQKLNALTKLQGKRIKSVAIFPKSGDLVFCTKKHAITLSADTQGLIQVKKQKLKKFMKNKTEVEMKKGDK
ncbi:MAG: hypothetical protein IKX14_07060 [Neisseriaceae bacterium]|nr:hypothetical protein [Neisseriaceae bacterium]